MDKKIDEKTSKLHFNLEKEYYLIKWEGYDHSVSSWEPLPHLDGCLDVVKAFDE